MLALVLESSGVFLGSFDLLVFRGVSVELGVQWELPAGTEAAGMGTWCSHRASPAVILV